MTPTKSLFTSFPIVGALGVAAEDFTAQVIREEHNVPVTQLLQWIPAAGNKMQAALLGERIWKATLLALPGLPANELSWVADWNVDVINGFLRREGFDIQLDPWDPSERLVFGVAAAIKLMRKWRVKGQTGYTVCDQRNAFRLGKAEAGLEFYRYGKNVVVKIPTIVGGDYVYITKAEPVERFDLLFYCMDVQAGMTPTSEFSGAILPNWSFQQEVDVKGLVGLQAIPQIGENWKLIQALMEGKSAFGPEGTSFRAAFAAAMMRESCISVTPNPRDHLVDYNLVKWIGRDNVPVPLGAVYIATSEFAYEDTLLEE